MRNTFIITACILVCSVISCKRANSDKANVHYSSILNSFPNYLVIENQRQRDSLLAVANDSVRANASANNYNRRAFALALNKKWSLSNKDADTVLILMKENYDSAMWRSAHLRKYHNYIEMGKRNDAKAELMTVVRRFGDPDAKEILAEFYFDSDRFEDALRVMPDSVSYWGEMTKAICMAILGLSTPEQEAEYGGRWNTPTIGLDGNDEDVIHFGEIGPYDRGFQEGRLTYPDIPNLTHRSHYALCKKDSCYANYCTFAVRCPDDWRLRRWVSERLSDYLKDCVPAEAINKIALVQHMPDSALSFTDAVCNYYSNEYERSIQNWKCSGRQEEDPGNKQDGLLLADCWRSGIYYTFFESRYSHDQTGGNAGTHSYITIDAENGRELKLKDFFLPDNLDKALKLMLPRLENWRGERIIDLYPQYKDAGIELLKKADGCALIREGFVIYYHPYTIASGADGMCKAVIPYKDLKGVLSVWWRI